MAESTPFAGGPMQGLRVLDVSTVLAGPFAAQVLGDFGADVIKVEHPQRPDSLRTHGPAKGGKGLWWKQLGRNKRCVGLYLGDPQAREVFLSLVASADVMIENFRPGTLERWNLGWEVLSEVNPKLILARISGFGQTGPYAKRPGFGTLAEAMSGFAAMTGEPDGPPTLPPFGLADGIAGLAAAVAVCMAAYHRDAHDGPGQVVDLSILEPIVQVLGAQPLWHDQLGYVPPRTGNRSANNAPRNTYRTSDGQWIALSTSANSIAERLLRLVGHPEVVDEPWFSSGSGRAQHADQLDTWVGDWIAQRTQQEVMDEFDRASVAAAPVYDVAGLLRDPHVQEREVVTTVKDEDFGELVMQNVLFRLSATPGTIRFTGRDAYSATEEILVDELGVDPGVVRRMREGGICA